MAFERMAYLEAVIGADITQFRRAMRDIRNDLGIMSETTTSRLGAIGRTMTYTLSVPLIAAGSAAVQYAATFENEMRNVNSIAQMSEAEFRNLSGAVLDWGSQSAFGATQTAQALYQVISAGMTDVPKAMDVMRNSTALAEATQSNLVGTTEALTAVMLSYAGSNMTAAHAADVMARTVQLGVGTQDDYNRTMQKSLPLANALGIAFDDLGAVQAVVSQNGSGLDKAGTSVAMMLSNLLKPTKAMQAAFSELGVSTGQELINKFGSLTGAVAALKANSSEIDFAKMFSKTGLEAAFTLTNNLDATNKKLVEFKDGLDGAVGKSHEEQVKSFAFQFKLLQAALEGAGIAVGEILIPAILPVVQGFTDFLNSVRETNPELLKFGVAIAAAVAAGAPLLWLLSSLSSPMGIMITLLGALGAAFSTNFLGIRDIVQSVMPMVDTQLSDVSDSINNFLENTFPRENRNEGKTFLQDLIPTKDDINELLGVPTSIAAEQLITIEPGDSLWSIWANDFADTMTWENFKTATGWSTGMTLKPGDILHVKGDFGSAITPGDVLIPTAATLASMLVPQPIQIAVDSIINPPPDEEWSANLMKHPDRIAILAIGALALAFTGQAVIAKLVATVPMMAWGLVTSAFSAGLSGALALAGITLPFSTFSGLIVWIQLKLMAAASTASALWATFAGAVGTAISTAFAGITAATGWIAAAAASVIAALGAALIAVPILIGLTVILNAIIPEETKAQWRQSVMDAVDGILGEGEATKIGNSISDQITNAIVSVVDPSRLGAASGLSAGMVAAGDISGNSMATAIADSIKKVENQTKIANAIQEAIAGGMATGVVPGGGDADVGTTFASSVGEGIENYDYTAVQNALVTGLTPPTETIEAATSEVKTQFDGMINAVVVSSGTLDPNVISTNYLVPLQTAFEATFGEASSTRLAYTTFFDGLITKTDLTGQKLIALMTTGGLFSASMIASVLMMTVTTTPFITKLTEALQKLLDTVRALQLASSKPIHIVVGTTYTESGTAPPGGGIGSDVGNIVEGVHAGGLDYVPHDNYIASLHQGESVLTAGQADMWRSMMAKPDQASTNTKNETTYQNNKIYISGVQNVDGMLKELERRGIKLG